MDTERLNLRQIQQRFAEYIVLGHNEAFLSQQIKKSHAPGSIERLTVYRNGYHVRLQEALANDFPALLAYMGDACFGKIMTAYILDHPPISPSLRQLGRDLCTWLKNRNYPVVWSEIAALEWAVLNAFDALDADLLSIDQLSQVPANRWKALRLRLHPSVSLLSASYNVHDLWNTVIKYKKKSPVTEVNDYLVVWRLNDRPKVQSISQACYELLRSWKQKKTFGNACKGMQQWAIVDTIPKTAAECLFFGCQCGWFQKFDG